MEHSRRDFIKLTTLAGATGVGFWLGIGCGKSNPVSPNVPKGTVKINLTDYPPLQQENSAVSINGTKLGRPLIVTHTTADTYHALDSVCTHQGCTVEPDQLSILCPCHGSRFSFTGRVLNGPAPRALTSFAVALSGSELTVTLG